jgi:hypothetical protein
MPNYLKLKYTWICLLFAQTVFGQIQKNESEPLGYGLKLGVNFPTIGAKYEEFSGLAGGSMGLFFTKPFNNHFSWYIEPAFSSVGFRNTSDETRFNGYYFDAGMFMYYYPSAYNTDFGFILGLRPSFMVTHNSQEFELGSYNTKSLSINKNENGRFDGSAIMGVGVSLSPVVNLELIYAQSLTNLNTPGNIEGRPSTVELNLRLNAVALKHKLDGRSQSTSDMVQEYHKGVLLVMLITPNEKEMTRLKKDNKIDEANLIRSEIKSRNDRVIKEFNKNFSFSPIFFFMDTSIYKVISGNIDGIFVNGNQDPDTTIKVNTGNYFIASFCEDISDYTKRRHFGLFVYDKQMVQLEKTI